MFGKLREILRTLGNIAVWEPNFLLNIWAVWCSSVTEHTQLDYYKIIFYAYMWPFCIYEAIIETWPNWPLLHIYTPYTKGHKNNNKKATVAVNIVIRMKNMKQDHRELKPSEFQVHIFILYYCLPFLAEPC